MVQGQKLVNFYFRGPSGLGTNKVIFVLGTKLWSAGPLIMVGPPKHYVLLHRKGTPRMGRWLVTHMCNEISWRTRCRVSMHRNREIRKGRHEWTYEFMIPIEGALSAAMDVYFPMQISHEKNLKRSKRDIHEIVSKGPFLEIILCTINIILGPPCNSIHPISFPPKLTGPLTSLAQIVHNYQRNKINHQPLLPRRGAIYIYIYIYEPSRFW